MPTEFVSAKKVQEVTKQGFERLKQYRKARAMFIKSYVGDYYNKQYGLTGQQPINLIFAAIRSLVPNIVMQSGVNDVVTNFMEHKVYAELLGLGLNSLQAHLKMKKILRGWIVDAIFGMGIIDTGISTSDHLINFGDINVDPGQIYSELVSIDDFTFDPICTTRETAAFMGRRISVPRQILLDDDDTDHDLVMRLPRSSDNLLSSDRTSKLTQERIRSIEMQELQDTVSVVKLWIPEANAAILIPDPYQTMFDSYIKITDYYGPKTGSYTFLSLTQPVPDNPIPIAPVSIWYDLHDIANRIFVKAADQAEAQKNIVFYHPDNTDEMEEARTSKNNSVIASQNPDMFRSVSFGGAAPENEFMIKNLQNWFNYIAGNPDQMAGAQAPGQKQSKQSATLSSILQSNAGTVVEDYRDIIYDGAGEISSKQAWYMHYDPLIEVPLIKRKDSGEKVQVWLTPEQKCGDFLEYAFRIVQRSMSRLDPQTRTKRIIEFGTNIIPAAATTAQVMLQMGVPFNLQKYLTRIAEELEIGEWVQDLFDDPEFEQRMQLMLATGPQNTGKGQVNTPEAINQNGGYPLQKNVASPQQEFNQQAQETAAQSQSANYGA